jgi:hypothetical protein
MEGGIMQAALESCFKVEVQSDERFASQLVFRVVLETPQAVHASAEPRHAACLCCAAGGLVYDGWSKFDWNKLKLMVDRFGLWPWYKW